MDEEAATLRNYYDTCSVSFKFNNKRLFFERVIPLGAITENFLKAVSVNTSVDSQPRHSAHERPLHFTCNELSPVAHKTVPI